MTGILIFGSGTKSSIYQSSRRSTLSEHHWGASEPKQSYKMVGPAEFRIFGCRPKYQEGPGMPVSVEAITVEAVARAI